MLTYTGSIDLYKRLSNNGETANSTLGAILINEGVRMMMGATAWPFLEKTFTTATVDGTQFYEIPAVAQKVLNVTMTVGTYRYTPRQVFSRADWDRLNSPQNVKNNNPSYFFVFDNQVGFWPTPSTTGNPININYQRQVRDLSVADYTTGTITSIANGGTTVVGSGTSWTANMAGKSIRFTHTNAANSGDGIWYEIASVTNATTLELVSPYQGTSIAVATALYTVADIPVIPENYQMGPVYWAVSEYWRMQGDAGRADRFENKYEKLVQQMFEDEGKKTTNPSIDEGFYNPQIINPNLDPTVTG